MYWYCKIIRSAYRWGNMAYPVDVQGFITEILAKEEIYI
jgi:hypothetical protein